jgi:hypothetical protein
MLRVKSTNVDYGSECVNHLKTKCRPLYLKTQIVQHSKHFSSQLQKLISLCRTRHKSLFVKINTKHVNTVWAEYRIVECKLLVHHVTSRLKKVNVKGRMYCNGVYILIKSHNKVHVYARWLQSLLV